MRILLDTHLLLWAVADSKRLPNEARSLVEDENNEVYYSAVNIWEIAIKASLRRNDFRVDVVKLLAALPDMDLVELPVTSAHAAVVAKLPFIHRDPFDRLLIAQSIVEPLILLTNDDILRRYKASVRIV